MTIDIFPTINMLARPGVTPSFPPFNRSTQATRTAATGVLNTVGTGVLRSDFVADSGAYRGLLLEGTRTNELLNSLAPATQTVSLAAGTFTLSVRGTGSATLSGAATGTATEGAPLTVTTGGGSVTVTISGSLSAFQLEQGAFATSIIPTTTARATRERDFLYGSTSSATVKPQEGTLYVEASTFGQGQNLTALELSTDSSNRISLRFTADRRPECLIRSGGVNQAEMTTGTGVAANTPVRMAVAYSPGEAVFSLGGAIVATAAPAALPATSLMLIGLNAGAGEELNGHVLHAAYFPRRLPDETVRLLTG